MTCEQAMELMSAMLDGELDPQLTDALNAHLETCPECKHLADTLRGLDEQLSGIRQPAPEGLKKGVLYRIDQATGKAKKPVRRWFGPGTAIGAAAAVLVLLVGTGVIPLGKQTMADKPADQEIAAPAQTIAGEGGNENWNYSYSNSPDNYPAWENNGLDAEADETAGWQLETSKSAVKNPSASGDPDSEGGEDAAGAEPVITELLPGQDSDSLHSSTGSSLRASSNPLDEETRSACAKLSEETGALASMVKPVTRSNKLGSSLRMTSSRLSSR